MTSPSTGPFRPVALSAVLIAPGASDLARHASVRATGQAVDVALPPLPVGQHMLPRVPLHQHPPDADWREAGYRAATPWVVEFRDVAVIGDAGIVVAGSEVVADTIGRAEPERDGFTMTQAGVNLRPAAALLRVDGRCLSLLGVGATSLYHWTIDGVGRLAAADAAALRGVTDLLIPALLGPVQRDLLARAGLPRGLRMHPVDRNMRVELRELVLPWSVESDFSVGGNHRPHPCVRPFFNRFTKRAVPPGPRRVYIDRRGGANRRLVNEDAVVAMLARHGFVAVRLEDLAAAAQIGVFAHAEIIVAPHGAGLGHIVHARPETALLELHAAHWVNWCFRRHAAVLGLRYDCVVGPALGGDADDHVNARPWTVSLTHLEAAVLTL